MDKNIGNSKRDRLDEKEEKKRVPVFVKYGIIAVVVIVAIVAGILIYFNIAGSYVATVDGERISTGEYKYYLEVQKESMLQSAQEVDPKITAQTFWATKIGGEKVTDVAKKKALDSIKDTTIQYKKAKEAKVSLTADQIKQIDASIKTNITDQMGDGNKIKAEQAFKKQYGFSIADFRSAQIKNYTVQKYVEQQVSKIKDADANVDTYYPKHPDWYKEDTSLRTGAEEAVWARHILISIGESATQKEKDAAKKKAEDLIAKLKAGADFVTLVKENSEDPGSKDRGGDYVFGKSSSFYTEFKNAAFALNPGQFTEAPVLTTAGYHIIQLLEKYPEGQPVSLKCAKEYYGYGTTFVKYKIYSEKLDKLTKAAKLSINNSVYNSITIKE